MAVKLSIVSSFDKKGVNQAEKALSKFQRQYKLTADQMNGFTGKLASASVALQQYGGRIQGYGSKMQSFGNAMTKYVTLPALGAAAALAGITLKKGWARLETLDAARKKLEALGHTAESVDSMMTSAGAAVKGTSFAIADAASMAGTLAATGIKQGEEMTRVLTLISDSATIAGTDYAAMGKIWTKVAASGSLTSKNLNALMGKGIPILQALGDYYGITADKAQEMVKKGKVGFADFANAMEQYLGGAAKKSASTFSGLMSQIGASVGRIGANLLGGTGGGIFSTLKQPLMEIRDALGSVEDVAAKWGAVLGEAFATVYERGKELVKVFMPRNFNLDPAKNAAKMARDFINDCFDVIIKIAKGVKRALDAIPSSLKKWLVFGGPVITIVGKLTSGLGTLTVAAGKLAAKAANMAASIQTGATSIASLAKGGLVKLAVVALALLAVEIGKVVAQASKMRKAAEGFEDGATLMRRAAGNVAIGMGDATEAVGDYMQACRDAIDSQAALADEANRIYSEAGAEIGKLDYYADVIARYGEKSGLTAQEQAELAAAIEYVNEQTGSEIALTDAANGKMSETPAAIQKVIKAKRKQIEAEAALNVYQRTVEQHIENEIALRKAQAKQQEISAKMLNATGTELAGLQAEYETLDTTIGQLEAQQASLDKEMGQALQIYGEYTGAANSATTATSKLGNASTQAAAKIATAGKSAGSGFVSNIASAVNGASSSMTALGTNVASAIGKGMGRFSFVASSATLASNLIAGIKKALGIHSPSREGIAIGENVANAIGIGFADGMSDASLSASRALSGFAGDIGAPGIASAAGATATSSTSITNIYIDGNHVAAAGIEDAVGRFLDDLATLGAMQNGALANG